MRLTLLLMTRNTPANDRATPAQADTLSSWPRNDEISRAKIGATETRMAPLDAVGRSSGLEIGRASGRERVGQTGEISVVDGYRKKKRTENQESNNNMYNYN